ncbi:MAG: hypothetical protein AAF741_00565 [Bacteroidota bacterium]
MAQNLSSDLNRVASAVAKVQKEPTDTQSLDELVATLAYYATAPDTDRASLIATGPLLLEYYAENPAMMQFINEQGLHDLLRNYEPETEIDFTFLQARGRESFLRRPDAVDLFSTNGLIDVSKIQNTYTAPRPPLENALSLAANEASTPLTGEPDANYISTALTGLSDWIGRRAQEELTFTFLTRLREQIRENELDHLFPETANYLPSLNLINYKSILPSLRLAFARDLNALALNLGNFLYAIDADSFTDPAVYNLFLVYRLLDLGAKDVPLSEILAFTYGELTETRRNLRRSIDLQLADQAKTSLEFGAIRESYRRQVDRLAQLEEEFQQAKQQLETEYLIIEDRPDGFDLLAPLDSILLPVIDFNYANLLFPNDKAPEVIDGWLFGQQPMQYYLDNPSLARYDQLYGEKRDTLTDSELIAAGLTGVREVLARRDRPVQMYQNLLAARRAMDDLNERIALQDTPEPTLQAIKDTLEKRLVEEQAYFNDEEKKTQLQFLRNLLEETLIEKADKNLVRRELTSISDRLDAFSQAEAEQSPNFKRLNPPIPLPAQYPRIESLLTSVESDFDQLQKTLADYSLKHSADRLRAHRNASNFETVFGLGQQMFFLLYDQEEPAFSLSAQADSIEPSILLERQFANTPATDLTDFTPTGQLTSYLLDPAINPLVRGLAYERIQQVPGLGNINAPELGRLLMDFTERLYEYRAAYEADSTKSPAERRIRLVHFITSTVSSIVQADILADPLMPGRAFSLADRLPGFASLPAINDQIDELFAHTQRGDYRYGISNLVKIVELFNIIPEPNRKQQKLIAQRDDYRKELQDGQFTPSDPSLKGLALSSSNYIGSERIQFLQSEIDRLDARLSRMDTTRMSRNRQQLFLYGTFMADVASADTPEAFAGALDAVALPPGSSQLKRNKPFSLELNAYFGLNYAEEQLNLPDNFNADEAGVEQTSGSVSLFVPVGLSLSWKSRYTQKSSYTLFFPFIDLGAVSAYRFDLGQGQNVERLPQFTFQNVFAPGAHLMYNFAKSPFTLGAGLQYGPSLRRIELDGAPDLDVSAVRFMISMSVDVPIFSFTNRP